jgi:hypothetical protein
MSNAGKGASGLRIRLLSVAFAPCILLSSAHVRAEGLIPGIDAWSREMVLPAQAVWRGARVPKPEPLRRPVLAQRRDSTFLPLSVHAAADVPVARMAAVLEAGEAALALWQASGLLPVQGDAGQGGGAELDLYLVSTPEDAAAFSDGSLVVRELDAERTFALLDARVSTQRLPACTAQALADATLLGLDPAEPRAMRRALAGYFAELVTGGLRCDAPADATGEERELGVQPAQLGPWLSALGARQDGNRGRFLADVVQLARQRTWEGDGLRASPSVLESIEAALKVDAEPMQRVLAQLADDVGQLALAAGEAPPLLTRLSLDKLPVHLSKTPPLAPYATTYVLVQIDTPPAAGERITLWSQGEYGVRWVLSAQRLDASFRQLGRVSGEVRDAPSIELHVELDADTRYVLFSTTNGSALRVPTLGPQDQHFVRATQLILDRRKGF